MKVYKIEVSFHDNVNMDYITVNIIHTSLIGLMKSFINETKHATVTYQPGDPNLLKKQTIKKLWETYKKYIEHVDLTFPIIHVTH